MPKQITKSSDYKNLLSEIWNIILDAKKKIVSSINTTLTITYWNIWKYIVEFEQNWEKRAKYWKELLKNISKYLTENFWKWYSVQNLERMRFFYSIFSKVNLNNSSSLMRKLLWTHIVKLLSIKKENERNFYIIKNHSSRFMTNANVCKLLW